MRRNMELIKRFFHPPQQSYFLFGPRGTGKSTLAKDVHKDALQIDLLDPETFRLLSARPERLLDFIHGNPTKKKILIDEIQKVPDLLSVVHSLIEEKKGLQFILTGSSARKLKKSGVDLLAGRALNKTLHPFMAAELKEKFELVKALETGMLPIAWGTTSPLQILKAYVSLYIKEEVQMEGLVRNIGQFHRFLEAASFSHAAVINTTHISRECEVERKVVENFISILEDLMIGYRLPVFTKRSKRETTSHPKFYFFDAGVFHALRPQGPLDRPEEIQGLALEGLIAQHLKAWAAYSEEEISISFWRTRHGVEVDFVVYGKNNFTAIEVKHTTRIREEHLRGLKSFLEDYPEANALFVYRGKERLKYGSILCLPCEEFLRGIVPNQPLKY